MCGSNQTIIAIRHGFRWYLIPILSRIDAIFDEIYCMSGHRMLAMKKLYTLSKYCAYIAYIQRHPGATNCLFYVSKQLIISSVYTV